MSLLFNCPLTSYASNYGDSRSATRLDGVRDVQIAAGYVQQQSVHKTDLIGFIGFVIM